MKKEILEELQKGEDSIYGIAKKYGVSEPKLRYWAKTLGYELNIQSKWRTKCIEKREKILELHKTMTVEEISQMLQVTTQYITSVLRAEDKSSIIRDFITGRLNNANL